MSRRNKVLIGVVFVVFALLVAGLPFMLMLVPNPGPQPVTGVSAAQLPAGVYVTTGGTTYRVHPYAQSQARFPAGALVAGADAAVSVRYRQLDDLCAYSLSAFPSGRTIESRLAVDRSSRRISLQTAPLSPGRYCIRSARDSMYGGTDYVYFEVAEDSASAASRR